VVLFVHAAMDDNRVAIWRNSRIGWDIAVVICRCCEDTDCFACPIEPRQLQARRALAISNQSRCRNRKQTGVAGVEENRIGHRYWSSHQLITTEIQSCGNQGTLPYPKQPSWGQVQTCGLSVG